MQAVTGSFLPVTIHIKEKKQTFERFDVRWTPTLIVLDPDGRERRRVEGFLPVDDVLAQLELGLAAIAFHDEAYEDAEQRFRAIVTRYASSGAAPEACYWAGVSRYKRTHDPKALAEAARDLEAKFPASEWARKAAVWSASSAPSR